MERCIDLRNRFMKSFNECNKELSKLIGKKSVYGNITLDDSLFKDGWLEFNYSQDLTNDEKRKVLEILKREFGILDRPTFSMHFNTEKGKYGLRWNTYSFFSYLKESK